MTLSKYFNNTTVHEHGPTIPRKRDMGHQSEGKHLCRKTTKTVVGPLFRHVKVYSIN